MNDGGPAFPESAPNQQGRYETFQKGMSLRDWFAAKAMEALMSTAHLSTDKDKHIRSIGKASYGVADLMLEAREVKS